MTNNESNETVAQRQERLAKIAYDKSKLKTKIDIRDFLSEGNYNNEKEKIFKDAWLTIGHTDDVPSKGSYFVYEVPTLNTSLLIMRGQDDIVRVFYNACRHRGNKLIRDGKGFRTDVMCNFHGWVFSTDGKLNIITDEHMFESMDKSEYGLIPVNSEIWENLIFINFSDSPKETLREWLGVEFYETFNGYWDLHEKVASYSFEIKANWHLCVNSFTEGYHTKYLHKNTARDYQGGKINPQRHRPHMELMKRHHRYSAPGNPDHQILPVESLAIKHGRKQMPAFDFDFSMLPEGVNPSRYEFWAFDIVEIFPNFVTVNGNHARVEMSFWPIDHERTLIVNNAYSYKTKNLGERLSQTYFRSRGRDVIREDLNTLEAQQQMLSGGKLAHVILSKQEIALQHHFAVTEDMLGLK